MARDDPPQPGLLLNCICEARRAVDAHRSQDVQFPEG